MTGFLDLVRSVAQVSGPEKHNFLSSVFQDECLVANILKELGAVEKLFVLRMMLLDRPIKELIFGFWMTPILAGPPGSIKAGHIVAIRVLVDAGILLESGSPQSESTYDLHPNFRSTLIRIVSSCGEGNLESSIWDFSACTSSSFSGAPKTGETKWHALLERVLSSPAAGTSVPQSELDMNRVILRLGFGTSPTPPSAFKFVLSDTSSQLWTMLGDFVSLIEREWASGGGLNAVSVVIRVIAGLLGVVSGGKNDSKNMHLKSSLQVDPLVQRTVAFLHQLDVLALVDDIHPLNGSPIAPPTPATSTWNPGGVGLEKSKSFFTAGATARSVFSTAESSDDILLGARLVVDSNMHVTAYTRSPLQVKLISLFCKVERILGNLVTGVLTRASVQRAIDGSGGVSGESIIKFLTSNLHPSCGKELPSNVSMQIRLWEQDCPRNRLKIEPCVTISWRADRTEEANAAIVKVKQMVESYKGLLFAKQDADGKYHIGVKADIARNIFRPSSS